MRDLMPEDRARGRSGRSSSPALWRVGFTVRHPLEASLDRDRWISTPLDEIIASAHGALRPATL